MKAKNRLMGLLCLKISSVNGVLAFLILLSNSCLNRPAMAQSKNTAKLIIMAARCRHLHKSSLKISR